MGAVIEFPESPRVERARSARPQGGRAAVIILPVIRIERTLDPGTNDLEPTPGTTPGRRRRRRASRS